MTLRNMRRNRLKMISKPCSRRDFLLFGATCFFATVIPFMNGCSRAEAKSRLVVACGNDLGGLVIQAALEKGMASGIDFGADEAFIGDCCGSTATFTLSTGDVDVAVLCPDAVVDLRESDDDFIELGTVVYDGNVLVSPTGDFSECKKIGYMDSRNEQLEDLKTFVGEKDVEYRALFTFATASALANGLIDAATMDVATAARSGFPAVAFTSGKPTSVLVARGSLAEDERLEQLVNVCNSYLSELQQEGEELTQKLCELFENDNRDEVMSWWQNSTTRFGSDLKMTK